MSIPSCGVSPSKSISFKSLTDRQKFSKAPMVTSKYSQQTLTKLFKSPSLFSRRGEKEKCHFAQNFDQFFGIVVVSLLNFTNEKKEKKPIDIFMEKASKTY